MLELQALRLLPLLLIVGAAGTMLVGRGPIAATIVVTTMKSRKGRQDAQKSDLDVLSQNGKGGSSKDNMIA